MTRIWRSGSVSRRRGLLRYRLTYAGSSSAYEALYTFFPGAAEFFSPVNESCVDNGIEMCVKAIYVHDDSADIYISMKDLTGDRIDETTDLFDSYEIRPS